MTQPMMVVIGQKVGAYRDGMEMTKVLVLGAGGQSEVPRNFFVL